MSDFKKSWQEDYIDVLGIWVDNDDIVEELIQNFPKLAYKCPTCESTYDRQTQTWSSAGYYVNEGMRVACKCIEQNRLHFLYSLAGIGENYQRMDWDDLNLRDPEIMKQVLRYMDNYRRFMREGIGIFMHGPAGSGKTLVANLIAKEMVRMGKSVRVFEFSKLVDHYTAGWKDNILKNRHERMLMQSDLLVIDDIGKEYNNSLGTSQLDQALRVRQSQSRPTIITSNLSFGTIQERYSEFIVSLITGSMLDISFSRNGDYRAKDLERRLARVEQGWIRPIV